MTRSEIVYHKIKQKILDGDYESNHKIKENEIAMQLNISSTPVREAFQRLAAEGYVDYVPYKSTTIKDYNEDDICEAYWLYCAIHIQYISLAFKNLSESDLSDLIMTLFQGVHQIDSKEHIYRRIQPFFIQLRKLVNSDVFNSCLRSTNAITNLDKCIQIGKKIDQRELKKIYIVIIYALEEKNIELVENTFKDLTKLNIKYLKEMYQL